LLPGVVRSYAPRGETPFLKVLLTRERLAVMSAAPAVGQVATMKRPHPLTGRDVALFLRHLFRFCEQIMSTDVYDLVSGSEKWSRYTWPLTFWSKPVSRFGLLPLTAFATVHIC
jgi:hypothetical protein